MARFVRGREVEITPHSWDSLEELRRIAMSRGCTPAQFKYAIEVMGAEPNHIAYYLQRHEFAVGLSKGTRQAA